MIDIDRCELKYRVDPVKAAQLKQSLTPYLKQDVHNDADGYMVRSLYFDSLSDTDFEQKVDGLDDRKKIRLRVYSPNAKTAKLEVKEKHNGLQRKRSLVIDRQQADALVKGNLIVLREMQDPFAFELWYLMETKIYRPKCIVEYSRYAMTSEDNDTRITFDSRLTATESSFELFNPNLMLYPVTAPGAITLEVKYNNFLMSNIKNALSVNASMQESISKYIQSRTISKNGRK